MNDCISARKAGAACLLLLAVLLASAVGCSSGTSGQTTTTEPGTASTSTTGAEVTTSTTAPIQLSAWDKELAKTASVQTELMRILIDSKAANNDPRMGIIYGLRARTQAIAARQALDRNELALADSAMLEVHYTLNLGRDVASGTAAKTLADARAIVENLGAPSGNPTEAATLLDKFIAALAPMLDEAGAVIPSTTTT